MSRTLFWYVFKDLLRIFLLACFSLAGIMSFGGLLRPLTDQGLDASQVGRILTYFLPAMMTYSLPIAAIFATTMVYGRLSADNELTACRAAGISYFSITTPALVLGLVVALISLVFLSFIVPIFSYKVEQVLYSNVAQLVANKIERQHQIRFEGINIFALGAQVSPQADQDRQLVILNGPMIVTYAPTDSATPELRIPKEFYMAEQADVYITQHRDSSELSLEAILTNGTRFPRDFSGASQGTVGTTSFGPYRAESPIHENTKFMDIFELRRLFQHPSRSKTINASRERFVRDDQEHAYLASLQQALSADAGSVQLVSQGEPRYTYTISRTGAVDVQLNGSELALQSPSGSVERQLHYLQTGGGGFRFAADARAIRITTQSDPDSHRIGVTVHLTDPLVYSDGSTSNSNADAPGAAAPALRADIDRRFYVPMTPSLEKMANRTVDYYVAHPSTDKKPAEKFRRDLLRLRNGIQAEIHGRASFAISCLILVMIGSCLGVMFRSGNFLSAFALSVIPAILTIALIITGQQVSENTTLPNALNIGLALIWTGNVTVLALAGTLLWRLQRT